MRGAVRLMIKLLRVSWYDGELQIAHNAQPYKIIVPYYIVRYHKETQKSLREQQLYFLIVSIGKQ